MQLNCTCWCFDVCVSLMCFSCVYTYTCFTVFQGSHSWHPPLSMQVKVTPVDCCSSDTLLLLHRLPLQLRVLQPTCCHNAVSKPELFVNHSAEEPIPAPDGKWRQMKTECHFLLYSTTFSKFCGSTCFWLSSSNCCGNQFRPMLNNVSHLS